MSRFRKYSSELVSIFVKRDFRKMIVQMFGFIFQKIKFTCKMLISYIQQKNRKHQQKIISHICSFLRLDATLIRCKVFWFSPTTPFTVNNFLFTYIYIYLSGWKEKALFSLFFCILLSQLLSSSSSSRSTKNYFCDYHEYNNQ